MLERDDLEWLSGGRWFVPILALASGEHGARFATLAARLGMSRSVLRLALEKLLERGWLMRNPGHGHPLRPEYILTQAGGPVGAWCERVMAERQRLGLQPADLPRWSMPIVARVGEEWVRFGALRSELPPITPRALSLTLKQMLAVDLVRRKLEDRFPPMPLYGLTGRGRGLAAAMVA